MPYQPATNSIIQAILMGRLNGQQWMNVIHFRPVDPPSGDITDGKAVLDEFDTYLDDIANGWSFLRAVYTSTELFIDFLQLQFIWPQRYAYSRYDTLTTGGTQAGAKAPQNVAAVCTYQSDETGRHSRGSMHIPGLIASDVQNGIVDSIIRGHIESEAAFLSSPTTITAAGFDYQMCLYQRANPAQSQFVTHYTVQQTSRVERRRTVGLGT